MPPMSDAQTASWHGLMDVHEELHHGWTLIGGQMVHLHCAERDYNPSRPTDDIDAVVDVRADPDMLENFTKVLVHVGFTAAGISAEGIQHRWVRGNASVDVLLPDGVGTRAASRSGVAGSPTISTPGGTQALQRSESVPVSVDRREGHVRRPNLLGALVMKAAAHTAPGDPARRRHLFDFVTLAAIVAARDFRDAELTSKDRKRLSDVVRAVRADQALMHDLDDASESISRLERAIGHSGQ